MFGLVNSADIKNIGVTNLDIQGDSYVGGLVGENRLSSNITNSYSSGAVSGDRNVGGLVGGDDGANIMNSYSSGAVSGDSSVGGLVGENTDSSYITNSYSSGAVSGDRKVGGLVGFNNNGANIEKSYSIGAVYGNDYVGGLVGENTATVTDSFWNTETSNQPTSAGSATGLTKAEMTGSAAETNMADLDFTGTVSTVLASDADSSADSYPILDSVDRQAQLVSPDVYDAPPTYTVDFIVEDSEGTAISGATVEIDGTDGATQDLPDGTYTITASADGYDTLNKDFTVDGADKTVTVTLLEEYTVDVIVEDSAGTAIDNATITIDGIETSTSDLTDGE